MDMERLVVILNKIKKIRVAVIGDFFLDKLLHIDRSLDEPSLETGLTAYQVTRVLPPPGAAGTVTNNLAAIGVREILAIGAIGDDGEGYDLIKGLRATGVNTDMLLKSGALFTPTYTKPMFDGAEETNRLDIRNRGIFPEDVESLILSNLRIAAERVDAIIALDQVVERNTGVITDAVRGALAALAREKPGLVIYADSRAHINLFHGVVVKCNHREAFGGEEDSAVPVDGTGGVHTEAAADTSNESETVLKKRAIAMSARSGRDVFVTWGEQGIIVAGGGESALVPAFRADSPIDICGAGDAATSGIVCALCCGASRSEAALIGNLAAGVTIRKIGVTGTASPSEIIEQFNMYLHATGKGK
jgi:bifunctional ADP-heptose synthase (sugar kinase/adenylyltransferase)